MPQGHAVVDGSNIATEGRSEPSLAQLREAVTAFTGEYDFELEISEEQQGFMKQSVTLGRT